MANKIIMLSKLLPIFTCILATTSLATNDTDPCKIKDTVDHNILPLIKKYHIPGIAIAVTTNKKSCFYNYGIASKETQQPITKETLFEIGSLSKTFTATLAAYAQVNNQLALSDAASKYLPSLRGSSFDHITLLNLGTHTSGGLPLQVPQYIKNTEQLMQYFKHWHPTEAAGTHRSYSNPSIGMLGMITAKSMQHSFTTALEKKLFPELGMTHSYLNVPLQQVKNYAQGYNSKDQPVRLNAGILASEAYGIKSTTADLIRFIEANMQLVKLNEKLQQAINDTHTGYFKMGEMIQGLIWEQYPYPVTLKQLLSGNSNTMLYNHPLATAFIPPLPPQSKVLINKTGSTNGFAVYTAFIPAKKIGIVILANKPYPIDSRVTAAYQILTQLENQSALKN